MSRYIDADKLQKYFVELKKDKDIGFGDRGRMISVKIEHIIEVIENAPSAEVIPRDYYEKVVEELCRKHTEEIEALMAERSE